MKLKILCIILAITTLAACIWAVNAQLRCQEYKGRLAELLTDMDDSPLYSPDEAAAEFEGGIVSVAEAAAEYAILQPYYEMLGMTEAEYAEDAKLDVLDMLVEEKILQNKAKEYGVYELDAAARSELEERVAAEYEDNVQYYMAFRFDEGKTEAQVREETIAYLNENAYSYEDLLHQAESDAWRDRLYQQVTKDMSISDEALREFYESQLESAEMIYSANYAEYESDCAAGRAVLWHPEGVRRVQVLLIPFDDEQSAAYADIQASLEAGDASRLSEVGALYQQLMPEAQEVLSRLQQGEEFESFMERYGTKPEGECISAQSSIFGDGLRDAAMALENIGDISGIVEHDEGLCILRYASDVTPGPAPFETLADELRENHIEELRLSHYNSTVAQWLREANVVYYPEKF